VWYPIDVSTDAAASAARTLDRVGVPVEPRAQWPVGSPLAKGRIAEGDRAAEGRALARLTDLGWGNTLRSVFASPDAPATPAMIAACVRVLADWGWAERPVGVIAMPSRSRPLLVSSVAEGLASAGRLPFHGTLDFANGGPSGEPGGNSAYRLTGVWDRFAWTEPLDGPVLLVDDLVDSRWTLTVAARVLRRAGASSVLPFGVALRG
jgi:ATP-dependent DNA helicase RecQ